MTDDIFDSSDSVRSARELKYAQTMTLDEPLTLELGGCLRDVRVAYETYGRLNEARDNAVLIVHAISGDSHVARHGPSDDPGWWDILVGPGKCVDTDEFFVISPNILGGCRGTTGPNSINPDTSRPYGRDFPTITIGDMVELQRRMIDQLGIEKLHAVMGGSMGGHQVLCWATKYPDRLRGAVALATSPRLTSQALAFDVVGRNAIQHDPYFNDGQYYDSDAGPDVGLAIARMIGHITYVSREAMHKKFEQTRLEPREVPTAFEKKFSVGSYLGYQGDKFVERFDANSYIALSLAMDLFDLGDSDDCLAEKLAVSKCRWLIVSFSSDWLFPPEQSRQLVDALIAKDKPVSYCNVHSNCGHDAFLLPDELDSYGELIRAFLSNLDGSAPGDAATPSRPQPRSTSIFHMERLDYDRIMELIPPGVSVLDLGCGNGELLSRLSERGHERLIGLEIDEKCVLSCVRRGLNVVHADLNDGLAAFGDGQFDLVVLSRTLQAVNDVEGIVQGILRIGNRCVVSFPNFGYQKLRDMLYKQGRAPSSTGVLHHQWYNSPNIRFFTLADFEDFCREKGVKIHKRIGLDTEAAVEVHDDPNRNADIAIFVISK